MHFRGMQILIGQNKIQTILSRLHNSLMILYIEIGRLFCVVEVVWSLRPIVRLLAEYCDLYWKHIFI